MSSALEYFRAPPGLYYKKESYKLNFMTRKVMSKKAHRRPRHVFKYVGVSTLILLGVLYAFRNQFILWTERHLLYFVSIQISLIGVIFPIEIYKKAFWNEKLKRAVSFKRKKIISYHTYLFRLGIICIIFWSIMYYVATPYLLNLYRNYIFTSFVRVTLFVFLFILSSFLLLYVLLSIVSPMRAKSAIRSLKRKLFYG